VKATVAAVAAAAAVVVVVAARAATAIAAVATVGTVAIVPLAAPATVPAVIPAAVRLLAVSVRARTTQPVEHAAGVPTMRPGTFAVRTTQWEQLLAYAAATIRLGMCAVQIIS